MNSLHCCLHSIAARGRLPGGALIASLAVLPFWFSSDEAVALGTAAPAAIAESGEEQRQAA